MRLLHDALFFALLAVPLASQQIIHVRGDATGANNGTSWADAFVDLQAALGLGGTGQEIWVAAGTYHAGSAGNPAASFQLRSGVGLYGGFAGNETQRWQRDVAANPTILHGDLDGDDVQGTGLSWYTTANGYGGNTRQVVTAIGVDATAVLDGFTIAHGWAVQSTGPTPQTGGGGLYIGNGSPRVANCTFRHCIGYWGGGALAIQGGSPAITGCTFVENMVSDGRGGAVAVDGGAQATLQDCVFRVNTARSGLQGVGGALYVATGSTAAVAGCRFVGNQSRSFYALGQPYPAVGGAVYNGTNGTSFANCIFVDNTANAGGGLFAYAGTAVTGCVFDDNDVVAYNGQGGASVGGIGGGLAVLGLVGNPPTSVRNCTFVRGDASDDGGGAYLSGTAAVVTGCVFWNNTDSVGQVGRSQCRGAKARFSCVQNLFVAPPGEDPVDPLDHPGSIDLLPRFVDPDGPDHVAGNEDDDLRLLPSSPCIDRADPALAVSGVDADGMPRRLDGDLDHVMRTDMGAFETGHARLSVQVTRGPTLAGLAIDVRGTPGMSGLLGIGLPGPETPLLQFGALFLDLSAIDVLALGSLPASLTLTAPRMGFAFRLQALALDPTTAGTLSNAVTVTL